LAAKSIRQAVHDGKLDHSIMKHDASSRKDNTGAAKAEARLNRFRLERLPGGTCTHWKAPPCHGAHPERTSASPKYISIRPAPDLFQATNLDGYTHSDPGPKSALKGILRED
jgi:hypothetical protein